MKEAAISKQKARQAGVSFFSTKIAGNTFFLPDDFIFLDLAPYFLNLVLPTADCRLPTTFSNYQKW